jgi:uncharacterized membrane protein
VAEFVGLVVSLFLLVVVVLPILSFLRLGRIGRELDELTARVHALEMAARTAPAASFGETSPPMPESAPSVASVFDHPAPAVSYGVTSSVPPIPSASPAQPAPPALPLDFESRIGGRGLLYTGILVLLLGVSFFLKYAFDNEWVNETGRVVLGALTGIGLIAGGLRLAATRGLTVFGQALIGTGLAILYLAVYAAFNFYALIGANVAFALMVLVTLAAAALADRQRAQALAIIAVGGGFLTPFLVSTGRDAQLTLFTYDALLVVGTLFLAIRHQWVGLNALSYVLTVATLLGWAGRYYSDDVWLRTLLFLTLFCVLFLIILRETARVPGATAGIVTTLLATAPLLYHIAAIVITSGEPPAIHIYLIAFTAAGLWLTADPHRPWLRLLVLVAGFAPMFGTMTLPDGLSWITPNVVTIMAIAALHTLAILDRIIRQERSLETADLLALHLTGLGLFALLYEALQPVYPDFRGGLAAIIALAAAALWQWLQPRDRIASLNAAALAFTLAAIGVAVQFDGPAATFGWAAEGAAAVWIGVRASSVTFQYGGLLLWGLAAINLVELYSDTPVNFVAVANTRTLATVFVVVLGYAIAWLFRRYTPGQATRTRSALHIVASVLTLMWITAEIRSFWEIRYLSSTAYLYEQMMLSLAWGLYGAVMIVVGMRWKYPLARYIGITVLAGTILKVFFYDLWELGGIYRVIGFIGFGVLLVLVSYLYQKRRRDPAEITEVGTEIRENQPL